MPLTGTALRDHAPATLSFAVLGPLELTGPQGPITVHGRRERAVLSALLVEAGDVVSIERLAEVVWGDRAPPSQAKVVQNLVLRLRKTLGPDVIDTRPTGYVLRVDRDAIDLHRFDRCWREGRACSVAGDAAGAAALLSAACELWRGPPLPDVADHPSTHGVAERLNEEFRQANEEHAAVSLALGRHAEWVPALEAMVREEPLREDRWSLLMLALHRCGRQADALRAFQRARAELADVGLEPGPELRSLERRVCANDGTLLLPRPAPAVLGNLTSPLTSWIGPVDRLRQLATDVSSSRLVTLTGSGGVGKTRLAIEAGLLISDRFAGGVWFIDLASVADPAAVLGVVARTIGMRAPIAAPTLDAIIDWLSQRPRALLILDNCEHLASRAAEIVAGVVARSASTTVLVTSREPLVLAGERVVTVASMSPADACQLFVERACAIDDSMIVSESDRLTIEAICRRLDGIPLAVELAAGRVRSSTPADILARLDDRFRLLQGGPRDLPPRQQTLRATVEWSHQLLDDDARAVFERASVFAGGFDVDAARAVLADEGTDGIDVAAVLDDLVHKSMLVADCRGERVRYVMLETLRQFGEEQLDRRDETAEMRSRHLAHYLGVARRADRLWVSPRQAEANVILGREWDNLRAAQTWAERNDPTSAESLLAATGAYAWGNHGHEHGEWAASTLGALAPDRAAGPWTLGWGALWLQLAHDFDQALALALRGMANAQHLDEPAALLCRCIVVQTLRSTGDVERARTMATELRAVAPRCTDTYVRSATFRYLIEQAFWSDLDEAPALVSEFAVWAGAVGAPSICSMAAFSTGRVLMWTRDPPDFEGAIRCYEQGLRLAQTVGDVQAEMANRLGLAFAHISLDSDDAAPACRVALAYLGEMQNTHGVFLLLDAVAGWFLMHQALEPAAVLSGYLDGPQVASRDRDHPDVQERRRTLLERPDGRTLMALGARMSSDEAVAYTLAHLR